MDDSEAPTDGTDAENPHDEPQPSAAELEAAGQSALFGGAEPASPQPVTDAASIAAPSEPPIEPAEAGQAAQPYRVLARKYRPQTFSELIGQEPMVQTLANAIRRQRLAHAFLMTGVRGVGKTSTARLIAKALNCIGPDGQGGPTIDPCGVCEPCRAIAEGRHIDVIEMDAASHTGIDDVREIIEAVRYAAVSARYKIYIIDEVHMLSRQAFNGLLKTLEEPPAHVKFLFATTEVDKLPVTVLSRTQRFDLRRIPADLLKSHFASVCRQEEVEAEDEALAMIAAAAEGSVRDGLSILDQAIAHADMETDGEGTTQVSAERVREMLGLADSSARRNLFTAILDGEPGALLDLVDDQYSLGVEPLALMRSLLDLVNRVTVAQVGRGAPDAASAEERAAIEGWAEALPAGQLHRLWQLLLKGHEEVRAAPDPLVTMQMALLRILHAADLPDPGEMARQMAHLAANGAVVASATNDGAKNDGAPASGATASGAVPSWEALVDRIDRGGNLQLAFKLKMQAEPIEIRANYLSYGLAEEFSENFARDVQAALRAVGLGDWQVEQIAGRGKEPTLAARSEQARADAARAMREQPLVKATLAAFPDAELIEEDNGGDPAWSQRRARQA